MLYRDLAVNSLLSLPLQRCEPYRIWHRDRADWLMAERERRVGERLAL